MAMVDVTQADRDAAAHWRGNYGRSATYHQLIEAFARHREAAITTAQAEAEALRAEVERLSYDGIHTCHDSCPRLPCVQRREIERLREALREALDALKFQPYRNTRTLQAIPRIEAALSEPMP
jgi:hypothetical protein